MLNGPNQTFGFELFDHLRRVEEVRPPSQLAISAGASTARPPPPRRRVVWYEALILLSGVHTRWMRKFLKDSTLMSMDYDEV